MSYQPGTHIIASLSVPDSSRINRYAGFRQLMDELVQVHGLQKLGEVYHDFEPAGFTGITCLSESHISIHTWPEHQLINMDIYLSNYQRNNDGTVQTIFESVRRFFEASVISEQTINR